MPKTKENKILGSNLRLYLDSGKKGATATAMAKRICADPMRYGLTKEGKDGISPNTITNFSRTFRATDTTVKVVHAYLFRHARRYAPKPLLPPIFLNVAGFFGTTQEKKAKVADRLEGHFQTYACSTTRPGKIRRGSMEFTYDSKHDAIRVHEMQHRPADNLSRQPVTVEWDGFAAAREKRIFCVMRTKSDHGDATPLFYTLTIEQESPDTGEVMKMVGRSMGVNEEKRNMVDFTTSLLVRKSKDEILLDFTEEEKVELSTLDINLFVFQRPGE